MKYQIIEDCSPYFIRFTYDGLSEFNSYVLNIYNNNYHETNVESDRKFKHLRLNSEIGKEVLDHNILSKDLSLDPNRVSYFKSWPGLYYRAHKDGQNHRFSINHTIKIMDNNCITSWYSDEDLEKYPLDKEMLNISREAKGFVKEDHIPLKSMIAQSNECILFNTDIFHSWDNTKSENERIILTLRSPTPGEVYFDDIKKILFKKFNKILDNNSSS